ncbi:MAG: DNA-protecting protein DprA [Candidatus Aminicenantes bacterium]|nr:DNA-protecting protein DprA [Candidatus Aminicenantes bacterium]
MEDSRKYWVAFNLVFAENLKSAKKIYERFPSLEEVFKTGKETLRSLGASEEQAQRAVAPGILDQASREIERLERKDYTLLTLKGKEYPEYLREIFDPPYVIYCAGNVDVLKEPAVSIVGARKPTPYGRAVAEKLAEDLASRGLVIVSGMARGIDSIAHWGALKGGKTLAVLGSGLENIYPRENRSLFEKIKDEGAVISEFPLKAPPLGFHFPIRNRIISGLSQAVVVVEAARRSGSLISARLALEQNREVMAVPGAVTSDFSQGTNWLIKTGAKLVENWVDVAEELRSPLKEKLLSQKEEKKSMPALKPEEKRVFEFLKIDSLTHIDELVGKTDLSVSELLAILLNLELKELIMQNPGKYFQRRK